MIVRRSVGIVKSDGFVFSFTLSARTGNTFDGLNFGVEIKSMLASLASSIDANASSLLWLTEFSSVMWTYACRDLR
jgi:hypothetical protein